MPAKSDSNDSNPGRFPHTSWSMVLEAQESDPAALSRLCRDYYSPLYGYACRLTGDSEVAKDLTQGFFEHLLSKEGLRHARQDRGKLRSFLLIALKRFSISLWRKDQQVRRGGGMAVLELDAMDEGQKQAVEPKDGLTPELEFDRAWARQLLDSVMARLARSYESAGKGLLFSVLRDRIEGKSEPLAYAEAAVMVGISEAALRVSAFKLRKRYRDMLQETIAETVSSVEELEEEVHYLKSVFAKPL